MLYILSCILKCMPELPEVETVKRGLSRLIVNKTITKVKSNNFKSLPIDEAALNKIIIGSKILSVDRKGKMIIIDLSSGFSLVVHLKMTGQLIYRGHENWGAGHPSDSLVGSLPDKHTRVILTFDDNSKLFFNDLRKFGWIKAHETNNLNKLESIRKLGPDPTDSNFSNDEFLSRLKKRKNSKIKVVLLDQTIISGVGNIYADESLFASKIHPESLTGDVSDDQLLNLKNEIQKILKLSIKLGGSTSKNYLNAEGKKGNYLEFAKVYGRSSKPCLNCTSEIIKIKVAGRGTHLCLNCQKKEKNK